jgi:hypothetical protein
VGQLGRGAGDRQLAIFQRLAHHLQHFALELRHLVQEEHSVVRQGHFAQAGSRAAADEAGI